MSDFQEIDEIVPVSGNGPFRQAIAPVPVQPPAAPALPPPGAGRGAKKSGSGNDQRKGIMGIVAGIGAVLAKWWAVVLSVLFKLKAVLLAAKFLFVGKLLLTGGTMLISMFFWSYRFGWPMAVGLVLSIFIHECGHALAAWKLGHKVGIMVFVPFMGAFVTSRGSESVTQGAFIGIMGPIFGTATAVACVGIYALTQNPFWLALAALGFFLNLINLTPSRPLDGGWIAPLFSPKLLLPGMVVALIIFHRNPIVWMMALMSLPATIHAWKHGHVSEYYRASKRDRWIFGLAYLGLVAFLATSYLVTIGYMKASMGSAPGYTRSRIRRG